jgi:hypothetical protein
MKGVSKLKRLCTVLRFTVMFMGNEFELKNVFDWWRHKLMSAQYLSLPGK